MDLRSPQHDLALESQPQTESPRWTVPDLIDFDYYVDADERAMRASPAERKRLKERDRGLYLERIRDSLPESAPEHSSRHRRAALRAWLEQRRQAEDPAMRALLPGASFAGAQRLVTTGLGILGWFIGVGVASALLHYDGTHPVNVSWYLFVLVLLQILLAVSTLAAWALRQIGRASCRERV